MIPAIPLALALLAAPPALEAAYKREVALLEAERDALVRARDEARAHQKQRAAQLRKELASLEAALVAQRARNDAATTRLQALERAGNVDAGSLEPTLTSLVASLRKAGVDPGARDLPGLLDAAATAIERGRKIERVPSGFFDAEGAWVDGAIVRVGRVASVGASPSGAGPLAAPGGDGPGQIVDTRFTELSRRFVDGGGTAPLFLGTHVQASADEPAGLTGTIEKLREAGPPSIVVVLLGVLLVGFASVRAGRLFWAGRTAARSLARVADLVEAGEIGAAEALCRAIAGPPGRLWAAVVGSTSRVSLDEVEESAAEALLDANSAARFGDRLVVAGAVVLVLVGALGAVQSSFRTLLSLEHALLFAAPVTVLVALARIAGDRLQREMERGALRLIDAARRARVGRA